MVVNLLWLAALGPLALIAAGIAPGTLAGRSTRNRLGLALAAALMALAAASVTLTAVIAYGAIRTELIGRDGTGLALYLDSVSAIIFVLVSFIGLIVVNYSRNYLDGDPGQIRFTRWLCLTLAAVLMLIISGNLFQFALAWIATSLSLHRLLVFYGERPNAVLAARKKFVASRLGDLCLIGAMVLLHGAIGTLDYAGIFSAADAMRASGIVPNSVQIAALLLVIAALLKSAQFPLHGWLLEVMETPTPVSALLHAGIINAGGFLMVRFAHVIALSTSSLDTLALIGGLTALFGSLVMLPQTSIKVSLAYSTIAQMGFMMLECGLGAFSAAFLHIVAHSFYKAHAFLSSGSVIDIARASWTPSPGGKPHPARVIIAIVAVLGVTLAVSTVFGATIAEEPGVFVLGSILVLSLVHLVANGIDERPSAYVIGRTVLLAVVVAVTYFGLQLGVQKLLAGAVPPVAAIRGPLDIFIVGLVVLSFAALTFFQSMLPSLAGTPKWQASYALVSNGFYVNTLANRMALRFWPSPPPRGHLTSPSYLETGAQS
jgi:NAD(P)H-quinone oxidoreductase subunit 5